MAENNMKAIREAVEHINELARTIYSTSDKGSAHEDLADKIVSLATAALAAPPRNCDVVPIEAPKAADMFHRERPLHGYDYETHEWLIAPAKEQKGGKK